VHKSTASNNSWPNLVPTQKKQETTLRIPANYTEQDAAWWLNIGCGVSEPDFSQGSWAIFEGSQFVGGISLEAVPGPGREHVRGLGYYIAPDARGRGAATRAVALLLASITNAQVQRIEASIFAGNMKSGRVLEKSGFTCEGRAKSYYTKDGHLRDAIFYAKIVAGN